MCFNMSSKMIKSLVSRNKRRYQAEGFDLDLTYISDRIIAMGFPASKIEGIFRNNIDDVSQFLETRHKDRYKLYNLCSERHYDSTRFHNRVAHFPFDDHNPPKIDLIKPFCEDVTKWLEQDSKNVVAIHCKAGKGRTGVMICCYLLHSSRAFSAKEALDIYDLKRTRDNKGVTIPSQRRYVEYYEALVKKNEDYQAVPLTPVSISFSPLPLVNGGNFSFNFTIYQTEKHPQSDSGRVSHVKVFRSETLEVRKNHDGRFFYSFPEDCLVSVAGDVRIEFKYKDVLQVVKKNTTFFSFWFNTFFVRSPPGHSFSSTDSSSSSLSSRRLSGNNTDEPIAANGHCRPFSDSSQRDSCQTYDRFVTLVLKKEELDRPHKDKSNKVFPKDFRVEVCFKPSSSDLRDRRVNGQQSSESSSSETDSSSDGEEWEGEGMTEMAEMDRV